MLRIKKYFFGITTALIITSGLIAKSNDNFIKGVTNSSWACNYTEVTSGFPSAGNVLFGDGTYVCDMDINNQRPLPGFPEGAHVTVLTGTFKKIDACRFSIVASAVALALQPDPLNPTQQLWLPFARIKDNAEMTLKGDTLTGIRTVSFYEYFDITLTKKLPIPDLVQTVVCQRVK